MASYAIKDFEWVRGTTPRVAFEFKTKTTVVVDGVETEIREPVIFDDARFTVYKGKKGGELLFRYSIATNEITLTDPDLGRIEFTIDALDTRRLQETAIGAEGKNRYEIELRNGTHERVYVLGTIAGIGGINDDEEIEDGEGN